MENEDLFSREDKTCRSPPLVGHAELGSRGQESMNLALIWDSLLMCYNRNTHNLPAFCTSCEGELWIISSFNKGKLAFDGSDT